MANKAQQAELEQMAADWLHLKNLPEGLKYELTELLAAERATVLEEVAGETRRFTSAGAVAQWCRQQIKERS